MLIDAPLPGVGPWEDILKNPLLWHFRFGGPDMERLVAGRERIYLDRFWNEFSATPSRFGEAMLLRMDFHSQSVLFLGGPWRPPSPLDGSRTRCCHHTMMKARAYGRLPW